MAMNKQKFNVSSFVEKKESILDNVDKQAAIETSQEQSVLTSDENDDASITSTMIASDDDAGIIAVKRTPGRPKRTDGIENRTKHFNFVMKPSVFEKLNILARWDNISVSDCVNGLVEDYVNSRAVVLEQIEETKRKLRGIEFSK